MPLKLAFGVGETVTGHRLDAPKAQCACRYWRLIDGTEHIPNPSLPCLIATGPGELLCLVFLVRRPCDFLLPTVVGL